MLYIQRLLVIRKLAFEFIDFQLGGFGTRFIFVLHFGGFRHHFILLFESNLQLFKIRFVAFNFFLLAQRGLHQIQVIARRLVIRFKRTFGAVMFAQLTGHIDVLVLLRRQLFARCVQFASKRQRLIKVNSTLIGVAHIIRRHIIGGFADQMLKQIAIGLGNTNRFQRESVLAQRRFHILERLAHAAVFRQ